MESFVEFKMSNKSQIRYHQIHFLCKNVGALTRTDLGVCYAFRDLDPR